MKLARLIALCLAGLGAQPQAADERARLAGERQVITQRFDHEEQACRLKFAVTGCLADVRARRRDALAPLRERELGLADHERQQRAQERRRAVAAKQEAAAERPEEVAAPVLGLRQSPAPARLPSASTAPRMDDRAAGEAEAAQRAQVHARRQADIDANQKRVADRVAARASEGKPVQPLPPLPPLPPPSGAPASQPQR